MAKTPEVLVTFPWPRNATTNHLYGANHHLTEWVQRWRDEARLALRQAGLGSAPDGWLPPYALCLDYYPPDNRYRVDGDNLLKQTADLIAAEWGFDDVQIYHHEVTRHAPDGQGARLEITMRQWREG